MITLISLILHILALFSAAVFGSLVKEDFEKEKSSILMWAGCTVGFFILATLLQLYVAWPWN